MKRRVLIIEDEPGIAETVQDTVASLGHDFDWVTNQEDARKKIGEPYDCVLLDLQLPARAARGAPHFDHGKNLLREIFRIKGERVPIILMTAYAKECLDLANELRELGAREFIAKPFPETGRTLASVIESVLREAAPTAAAAAKKKPKTFAGGELVLVEEGITLCGRNVLSDTYGESPKVVRVLAERDDEGAYVRRTSRSIADELEIEPETVRSCISTLRKNCTRRLKDVFVVAGEDVIATSGGYYLRDWITVRDEAPARRNARK